MGFFHKIYTVLIDLVETLVIAGAVFVVIYAFLFRPFQVNGKSMYPTYDTGEYVLTNLITLRLSSLKRGDVIVFKAPPNQEKDYIKRVIGIPGDSIMIKNEGVYVNDQKLEEPYLASDVRTYGGSFLADGQKITVPADNYFVMGDNRTQSSDSREWGYVPKEKLIGKSMVVYWPPQRFRIIKDPVYTN